jgi:hypothetical protein
MSVQRKFARAITTFKHGSIDTGESTISLITVIQTQETFFCWYTVGRS